jgi:hypothetical protein
MVCQPPDVTASNEKEAAGLRYHFVNSVRSIESPIF